jgi:hypothetical protein
LRIGLREASSFDSPHDGVRGDGESGDHEVRERRGRTVDRGQRPLASAGTATHVALVDGTRPLYVTTCTSQALTSGNTVNFPVWDIEIADPT